MHTLCPSRHELQDFSLGQIAETIGMEVEQHLSHCPECLATLDDLRPADTLVEAVHVHESSLLKLPSGEAIQRVIAEMKKLAAVGAAQHSSRELALKQLWSMLPAAVGPNELARIDDYRILSVLGCGGMGVVLLAEDDQLKRRLAIKVLSPLLAAQDSARKRFLREAQAAASITHPNLAPIYHVGEVNGLPYFVMPYLEGETLDARLRRDGPLPTNVVVKIGHELAEGLSVAHRQGLLHRDIKPANIWLQDQETPVLLDFGLSWVADGGERLTECGTIIGTPPFMSPEQARGESVDGRSDLFALGSVLYTMCTGTEPFRGDSVYAILEQVRAASPRPVLELNPQVPRPLATIITKLHEKNPHQRYKNATEVACALAQVPLSSTTEGDRKVHRFRFRAAVALILCLGLGIAGLLAANIGAPEPPTAAIANPPVAGPQQLPKVNQPTNGTEPIKTENSKVETQITRADPAPVQDDAKEEAAPPDFYPAALFTFEERGLGVKDFGAKVADLLFARLAVKPEIYLVDRVDLKKTLAELELNLSGVVKSSETAKIGQLTGAKLFISGSVFTVDKSTYIVARVVGTETGRMVVASVNGKSADELAPLVEKLGDQIADKIKEQASTLVARVVTRADRLANLKKAMKKGGRPVVMVQIAERHVGAAPIDPAAQTEIMKFCKEAGFTVLDPELGLRSRADVLLIGEGMSETATRNGNLISVKARVELRAVDRATDKVLAADRQTTVVVDLTEQIAGKSALEEAAAMLAERILPKLVKE